MNTKAWNELLKSGLDESAYPCYAAAVTQDLPELRYMLIRRPDAFAYCLPTECILGAILISFLST